MVVKTDVVVVMVTVDIKWMMKIISYNTLSRSMVKFMFMGVQNLTILRERCSDPALSVRKQALQSLTDLLDTFPQNELIQKYVIYKRFMPENTFGFCFARLFSCAFNTNILYNVSE